MRVDGSPLDNLAGYRIYYGTSNQDLGRTSIEIANPSAITWTVNGLERGKWYFAVAAFDRDGYESNLSNIAVKTIP